MHLTTPLLNIFTKCSRERNSENYSKYKYNYFNLLRRKGNVCSTDTLGVIGHKNISDSLYSL